MLEYDELGPLLRLIADGDAHHAPFDAQRAAQQLGCSTEALRRRCDELEAFGLALFSADLPQTPLLLNAGRQYVDALGAVNRDAVRFLPRVIDDLHAREALLHAGTIVVDELRVAINTGSAVEHARSIVPPAFAPAIDEPAALALFAAAVALTARLSAGEPAGCVAEEIVAVEVLATARSWLEMQTETGELAPATAAHADDELRALFELFQDDDVLDLFDMHEPADAALARHTDRYQQLGVVDQRFEAWFEPFGWTIPTGYLGS